MFEIQEETSAGLYTYYINQAKRVITAVFFPYQGEKAVDALINALNANGTVRIEDLKFHKALLFEDKYVGIARCHPSDVFDTQKGLRIAALRAEKAYKKDYQRMLAKCSQVLSTAIGQIDRQMSNNQFQIDKIDSLIGKQS